MIFKQFLYLLFLSVFVTYFNNGITVFLQTVVTFQDWMISSLSALLPMTASNTNALISTTIVLAVCPFIIVVIPAFLYWLSRQKEMPHLYSTTWFLWVVSSLIFILQR